MLQTWRKSLRRQEGFTLIEMMAVVLIIGILVAVATVSIPRFLRDARKSNLRQTIAALQVGAERFRHNNQNDQYPVTGGTFAAGVEGVTIDWAAADDNGEPFSDYVEGAQGLDGADARDYALDGLNNAASDTLYLGISDAGTVFVTNVADTNDEWADDTIQVFTRRGIVTLDDIDAD